MSRLGRPPDPYLATLSKAERTRRSSLMTRYGIDLIEYQRMEDAQEGKCAICGVKAKVLHVDHDHNSGRVRELLCHYCNQVGMAVVDNGKWLDQLLAYKSKHEGEAT